jgi:hypothetical protein
MAIKKATKAKSKKNVSASYNQYKFYNGKQYTGMKVGRSHKWYYDKGIWHDKKLTPDKWAINFEVTKRRAGKAPEGSGVPVGTEYHWYILAHQLVKKLDANSYSTAMNGVKFKLAHKRSTKKEWSINDKAQRKQLIKLLKSYIKELEEDPLDDLVLSESGVTKKSKVNTSKKAKKATSKSLKSV